MALSMDTAACANNSIFDLFKMPCSNDASVGILHEIFGNQIANMIPGVVASKTPTLIPSFIHNFNMVLLTGALLVYAIIIIAGTVNTGHQGKFLGQQWDSIWTPLRVIGGTACMVPLKYGLAAAQVIVLALILYGVHAATTVWSSSLADVEYGTPPTVPASGMDMIKQAIANNIILRTYVAINGGQEPSTTPEPLPDEQIPFFDQAATALQQQASDMIPDMCKAALGLASNGHLLPDSGITGTESGLYGMCKKFQNDFLQSGKPYYVDATIPASTFGGRAGGGYPTTWIGQLPGYTPCLQDPNGQLTAACYQNFPTRLPDIPPAIGVYEPYIYNHYTGYNVTLGTAPNLLHQTIIALGAAKDESSFTTPDGVVLESNRTVTYQPASSTSNALANLQADITTFVQQNVIKCTSAGTPLTPDSPLPNGCSNNLNQIITDFNNYLAQSANSSNQNTLSGTNLIPTAQNTAITNPSANPMLPGTSLQLNSSWWNAGEVYLMVDQKMAQNLSNMFSQLAGLNNSKFLPQFVQKGTFSTAWVFSLIPSFPVKVYSTAALDSAIAMLHVTSTSTDAPVLWHNYLHDNFETAYPQTFSALSMFPEADSLGLYQLGLLAGSSYPASTIKVNNIFVRLYQIMQANNMLNGGFSSTLPIKNAMNKIFDGLLGSQGSGAATSITSLMNEVYNIGITDNKYGFIGKNLSVIQNAQRTGMDMIATTINSIESVYTHYEQEYSDLRSQVTSIGLGTTAAAGALSAAAITAGFGGPFSAGAAAALGAGAEVSAQAGQMSIQIITMLKMSDILQSLMWLPIVIVVLTALFTAGVSFALMLPLMPFILFWAGQIAWILGCLEAVIAAPFLMLALILPGGHHFAGHSVPGLRMLLGIIFRPVLMVLGLLIGLVLTYIIISFSADAFHVVAVTLIGGTLGSNPTPYPGIIPNLPTYQDARGVIACLMLFLYCSFLMLAFQKCFSPIYLLPEKVIQMMGGQADKAGEQDLQQLQQGVNQQSQSLAQSGGQAVNKGIEAQQQKTQSKSRAMESGSGSASKPYSQTKSGLYDKEAWQRHQDANSPGSAGLGQGDGGSGGASGGGQSPDENAIAAQRAAQPPKPRTGEH